MKGALSTIEYFINEYGLKAFEKYGWPVGLAVCLLIVAIVGGAFWYFGG